MYLVLKNMGFTMKKAITIILCVLSALLTITATVFILIKTDKIPASAPLSSLNETSNDLPTNTESNLSVNPELTFTSPQSEDVVTTENSITFSGSYFKNAVITLNDEEIVCDSNGNFSKSKELKYGNNQFIFSTNERTKTFNINRRYVIISSYSPKSAQSYSASANFPVSVTAREGSEVYATFNGTTIALVASGNSQNGFLEYNGSFKMPSGHFKDLNLGKVTFKGIQAGFSESFTSGNVTCRKEDAVIDYDPNVTPKGGIYTNVGSGIITEIVAYQAETFNAGTGKDTSVPNNNYLPKGTVDYGSADTVTVKRDGDTYKLITLRCGKTVYESMRDKPTKNVNTIAKQYIGSLPDHNEIALNSFQNNGSHTVLKFDTLWKAPFYFDILPQSYNSDYTVSNVTYSYVDITFCYATVFTGEIIIPQDNPLFSSAKIIQNTSDYTLRLYLKKQGGFYGWDSYYDLNGSLCFEFLNPAKITLTDANAYGADLTNVKILIDVGHGGIDAGSVHNKDTANRESARNLILAQKLEAELTSIGATVYLTRTSDTLSTTDDKLTKIKELKPDYCIAIHHDYNKVSSLNGFGSYYYTPFSKKASQFVSDHTFNTGIYNKKTLKSHKYFMSRSSVCPVILTENGYMSNNFDYNNIINDSINTEKAKALTRGIVEYFQHIQ